MTNRVRLGAFNAGGFGLRVSSPGYDVNTVPVDNTKLVFNSDWAEMATEFLTFSITVPPATPSTPQLTTVTYPDLGYVPFMIAQINTSSGLYLASSIDSFGGNNYTPYLHIGVFSNKIEVRNKGAFNSSPPGDTGNDGTLYIALVRVPSV